MSNQKLFILSEHALTNVFDQIKEDQWSLTVPESVQKDQQTIRQVMNYHAFDDAWVPDVLSGKTKEGVGNKYDGDLLGDTPKKNWDLIVSKAVTAVESLSDSDLERIVHLSYGEYPIKDYLWHITLFRTYRAVDIARFLNIKASLSDELVKGLWEIVLPNVEILRSYGIFGKEVRVSEDAPLYEKLLAISGRQPK